MKSWSSKILSTKLATLVEGDLKAPFSIPTTPRVLLLPWIALLYPLSLPYNAEC